MRRRSRAVRRMRGAPDHGARADPMSVLQRHRRLGRGAGGQGQHFDSARGQCDIKSFDDADRALAASGADAVMVGRAAQGRPWLPARSPLSRNRPARERAAACAQFTMIAALYEEMLAHHGLRIGLKHARKHLGWALDAAAVSAGVAFDSLKRWRGAVLTCETATDARARLAQAYDAFAEGARHERRRPARGGTCRRAPPTQC